jgi:hypothetical protein
MDTIPTIQNSALKFSQEMEAKLKQALTEKPLLKKTDISSNLPTNTHTIENVTSDSILIPEKKDECVSAALTSPLVQAKESLKNKKIFKIKKFVKYNKFISEICSDESSDEGKAAPENTKTKKISPFSKVNFSKLKSEEKDERLKNLAKLVKRLRRKVRNLETKVKSNASKLLNKYLYAKLGINTKNKYLQPDFQFDFEKIVKALRKVRDYEDFEYSDQKHLIENIINLIADDQIKLDSLAFKRICSQVRMLLPKERVKYISKKQSKVTISFPETEVNISNKEYLKLVRFKDNEDALRAILGIESPKERTIKIITEEPKPEEKQTSKFYFNIDIDASQLAFKPLDVNNISAFAQLANHNLFQPVVHNNGQNLNPALNTFNPLGLLMLNNNPLLLNQLAMALTSNIGNTGTQHQINNICLK